MNQRGVFFLSIISLLCVLLHMGSPSAEYYQYVDEQGNIIFTDNPTDIPQSRRQKSVLHPGVDQAIGAQDEKESLPSQDNPGKTDKTEASDEREAFGGDGELDKLATSLHKERRQLEIKRKLLDQRQKLLKEKSVNEMTPEQTLIYANEAKELNHDIELYESERQRFSQKVTDYNNMVRTAGQ